MSACRRCGTTISPGSVGCQHCGAVVPPADPRAAARESKQRVFFRDQGPTWEQASTFDEFVIRAFINGRTSGPEFQSVLSLHGQTKINRILEDWVGKMIIEGRTTERDFQLAARAHGRKRLAMLYQSFKDRRAAKIEFENRQKKQEGNPA